MTGELQAESVPPKWRLVRLGDVVRDAQPGFASGDRDSGGVVQIRMNNINSAGTFQWSVLTRVPADPPVIKTFAVKAGDVLFNNTNSAELVGKSALFEGFESPVVFSNHFTRLRADEAQLAPEFLAVYLHARWSAGFFKRICHRWIGQAAVQRERLLDLQIPLPEITEQKRIATRLRRQMALLEAASAAANAQLNAAKALPVAYLRAIFEDHGANGWPRRPLGDLSEIVSGITLGRPLNGEYTARVPYLRVANVKDGYLDLCDVYDIEASEKEIKKLVLQQGDLLLTEGGDPDKLGRGTVWRGELPLCVHQNHIFRVRFNRADVDPEFVAAQVGSPYGKSYFLSHAKRTIGIATINRRVLAAFPLMIPPHRDQERIVKSLAGRTETLERMMGVLDTRLAETAALRASVLRSAFTGTF